MEVEYKPTTKTSILSDKELPFMASEGHVFCKKKYFAYLLCLCNGVIGDLKMDVEGQI